MDDAETLDPEPVDGAAVADDVSLPVDEPAFSDDDGVLGTLEDDVLPDDPDDPERESVR